MQQTTAALPKQSNNNDKHILCAYKETANEELPLKNCILQICDRKLFEDIIIRD